MGKKMPSTEPNPVLIIGICMIPIGVALSGNPAGLVFMAFGISLMVGSVIKQSKKKK